MIYIWLFVWLSIIFYIILVFIIGYISYKYKLRLQKIKEVERVLDGKPATEETISFIDYLKDIMNSL